MRGFLLVIVACIFAINAAAQKVTIVFDNTSMSEALKTIAAESGTEINFIYDELEDFRVTATIDRQPVETAVKVVAGFYPVRVTQKHGIIAVECTRKAERHYCGTVTDENLQPLPYATVMLFNPNDSTFLSGGISNEGGVFVVPCDKDRVVVKVSFIGYKTVSVPTADADLGTIRMEPEILTIEGVEVRGNRKTITSQVDRMQYNVAADPFAKGLNAQELMRRVPLLSVSQDGIEIVGKSNTHILIDGRELPANMINAKLAALNSEDIEKVEVITIPPSKFKAEANAGYVNIILKKDKTLGVNGTLGGGLTFSDRTSWSVSPSINYANKKFDISVASEIRKTNGLNVKNTTREFDDYDKISSMTNTFDWMINNTNVTAKYKINNNLSVGFLGGFSGNDAKTKQSDITTERGMTTVSNMQMPDSHNYSLPLEFFADVMIDSTGKFLSLTYDCLNNYEKSDAMLTSLQSDGISNKIKTLGDSRYRIDAWKADFLLPFQWADIETGAAFTNIRNSSMIGIYDDFSGEFKQNESQSNDFDYDEKTAALYISAHHKFGEKFTAKVGLRAEKTWIVGELLEKQDKHDDDYLYVFPTVHLGCIVSEKAHIGAAYSRGISRPNFMDLNPFRYYITSTKYVSGNSFLLPGLTDNFEVNFSHDIGIYAVLYESRQHDGIAYPTILMSDGTEVTTGVNCYESDKTGLYASWGGNIWDWLRVQFGGEVFYSGFRVSNSDFGLVNTDGWSGKLEADLDISLNSKKTLVFNLYYEREFPYVDGINKYRTWVLFGGGLRYSLIDNRLKLRLNFNDPFHENLARTITRYDGYTERSAFDCRARAVSISASYFLGGQSVRRTWRQSKNTESSRAASRR